ncbi:MAG: hypothetical protein ACFFDN_19635 [Candidatus Hodarchaeota archaeon]
MQKIRLYSLWENIIKKETVKIAIDGSSYSHNDESLNVLSTLGVYNQFEVLYVSSKGIKDKNLNFKFCFPEHKRDNEIILKSHDSNELWRLGYKHKEIKDMLSVDTIAAIAVADIVVTEIDIYSKVEKYFIEKSLYGKSPYICKLTNCLSAIRAWINNLSKLTAYKNNTFWFSRETSVNFAIHMLLPYLQTAWRAAVVTKADNFPLGEGTVRDFISSTLLRSKHLLTTRDLLEVLKINTFERFNPKAEDYSYMVIYYFGYFLLLITAMIDSISWIANWRINRHIKSGLEVSFRKTRRHFSSFIKYLSRFDNTLSNYIASDSIQSLLELVYYLRNFFAHNILPSSVMYSGSEGFSGDLISLKGDVERKIQEFSKCNNLTDKQLLEMGIDIKKLTTRPSDGEKLIEPILFSRYILMRLIEIVDTIFKHLCIENKMITSQEEKKEFDRLGRIPLKTASDDFSDKTNKALSIIEASVP